ncbi:MAG TPA: hypothetical protein VLB50_04620 [Ignavibacteriaceae bacterium]|nr:hypothetical protein [Ignavibacteriaceae bacterium]
MKISLSRTNIISILLVVTILLLGFNIIIEKYYHHLKLAAEKGIPSDLINKRFLTALKNYNIDSSWISIKDLSKIEDDSLKYWYNVKIPEDLPPSLLIKEIKNQFDTNEVNIYAVDKPSETSVEVRIFSSKYLKLSAAIKNNDLIHRKADSVAFVITGIEDLNSENLNDILKMPEQFTCVLVPSKHSLELVKLLNEEQKQTAVLLNDDIPDLEYKLKSNYSKNRIRNSLKSISTKFSNATFFIMDNHSDIYNSDHSDAIRNWFEGRVLVPEEKFSEIEFTSAEEIFLKIKSEEGKKRVYRISAVDFLEMSPVFASLRKLGYRIVYPSVLIRSLI